MKGRFVFTSSWDDGTIHDLRLAHLLAKYNLPGTFYFAKQHPYGALPSKHIQEISSLFELGAHTLAHTTLTSVSHAMAADEIRGSKAWVEELSGAPCRVFCFPGGKFSMRHLELIRDAGLSGARTVELASCAPPKLLMDIAVIPTSVQAFPRRALPYVTNALRRGRIANFSTFLTHGYGQPWNSFAASLLRWSALHGGVFHLWGHAWELDQYDLWADLEALFQLADGLRSSGDYLTNGELALRSFASYTT